MCLFFPLQPYLKTAFSGFASRGISVFCKFITIPLLLQCLETKEYAALAIFGSLEAWFLLLDFGIGSSIQNHLSECREQEKALLKTAFVLALLALSVGTLLLWATHPILESFLLKKILFESPQRFLGVVACFFLLGTFGSIASRVLIARQQGFIVYFSQGISSSFSLILLLLFRKHVHLMEAIFFTLGIPSLVSLVLSLAVFSKVNWKSSIRWDVLFRAKKFGCFACMAALVLASDALIMPRTLEAFEIVQYHLLVKLFGIGAFIYSALLQGLWPSCSERWSLGDGDWVVKKISFMTFTGIIGAFCFTGGVLLFRENFETFFSLSIPLAGILWSGIYLSVRIFADFHAMALQSRSDLNPFFYLVPAQAVLSLCLQWFLSISFGMPGIFAGLTLSYLATVCWALPRRLQFLKDKAHV